MKNKTLIGLTVALAASLSACTTPTHVAAPKDPAPVGFEEAKPFSNSIEGAQVLPSANYVTEGNLSAKVIFGSKAKTYRKVQENLASPLSVKGKTAVRFDIFSSKNTSIDVAMMVTDKWVWKSQSVKLAAGKNVVYLYLKDFVEKKEDKVISSLNAETEDVRSFVLGNWTEVDDSEAKPEDRLVVYVDNVRFIAANTDLINYGFENATPFRLDAQSPVKATGATVVSSETNATEGKLSAKIAFASAAQTYRIVEQALPSALSIADKATFDLDIFAEKAMNLDVVLPAGKDWNWYSQSVALTQGANKVSLKLVDFKHTNKDVVTMLDTSQSVQSIVLANWTETSDAAAPSVLYVDNVRFTK